MDASTTFTHAPARAGSWLHRFANPGRFLRLGGRAQPWLNGAGLALTLAGLGWGLFLSPADWQQGDTVRIMYIHVPAAWLASAGYASLAACSFVSLIWRHPLADLAAVEIGPVGAGITALCLATGSLWGKPMWGAWWVWDARLTSVLVLFFLYLGHIALVRAFDDPQRGYRAGAILALVGVINLPIIKFSVQWWNTLHQPASITLTGAPTMDSRMLWPLAVSTLGFTVGFAAIVCARLRAAVMERRVRGLLMARADGASRRDGAQPGHPDAAGAARQATRPEATPLPGATLAAPTLAAPTLAAHTLAAPTLAAHTLATHTLADDAA